MRDRLDEGAITQNDAYPPEVRNLAAVLFQLEKAGDEATWRSGIRLPDIDDFQEVHAMLQQRVEQWNEAIREQGRQGT